ncbi:MAG: dihydrofolate reductase [Vicinamibacterales bacterium]
MSVAIIAAVGANGVIGRDGGLPWHLPEDLKRFKALTMGHTLVMGRETYDAIGRPLPGRRTIVVTRQAAWSAPGVDVAHSVDEALLMAGRGAVFVAGGGEIYRQCLDRADVLHLTLVDTAAEGDTWFPEFDRSVFREVSRERHADGDVSFAFVTYERAVPVTPGFPAS